MNKSYVPVYPYSLEEAQRNGETDLYKQSHNENIDCAQAIRKALADNFDGYHLKPGIEQKIIADFGFDRTMYVLANTIQHFDYDGRISRDNKEWAKAEPVPNDYNAWGEKKTREYCCNQAHPGLINLFINRFRKEQELEKAKKPSVLKKLKEVAVDTQLKAPVKKKEVEL